MINKSRVIKLGIRGIILTSVVLCVMILGITWRQKQIKKRESDTIVIIGAPKKGISGIKKEFKYASTLYSYLKSGDALMKQNRISEAITEYEKALSMAKSSGSRRVAHIAIANAYEKKRDYKKALELVIIDRDKYVNDWGKAPTVERAKYLEYALNGDYELAVEHAKKALEEDKKLPNRPKEGRSDYIERLNDLITAKDYILSLKKSNP